MPTIAELIAQQRQAMASSVPPSVAANAAMVGNREQQRQAVDTSGSAMLQGMASRLAGNVANIPDVLANMAARGVNTAVSNLPDIAKDVITPYQQPASRDVRQLQTRAPLIDVPVIGQEFFPGPTGADLLGLVQRGGEVAGAIRTGDFNQFRPDASAQQQARTEAMQQQSPTSFWLGQIGGDVMTLMTARAPIASARGQSQLAAISAAKAAEKAGTPLALAPSVAAALKSATVNSKTTATLLNRAGRAVETGLEGFALAALNGQADPIETAAFAAGTQAAGSVLLSGMAGLLSGGPTKAGTKLAISAVAIGALMQIFKAATPAGDGSPVEVLSSLDAGFNKVALGLAAGVVSGAAGMGRVTNRFPVTALPQVADMITSMPRAATISVLTQILDDPAAEAVVSKISTDPGYFDPASLRRIERAFVDENVNISTTIEELMNNREFRQKFEALQ